MEELTGSVQVTAPEEDVRMTNTDPAGNNNVGVYGKHALIDTEIGSVPRKHEHVEAMA